MGKMKQTYEEKIRRNLLAASESLIFALASLEWRLRKVFTDPYRCELCGHVITHNFELENECNGNVLRVGCCCVENYLVLAGHDSMVASNATAARSLERAEQSFRDSVERDSAVGDSVERDEQWIRENSAPYSRALLTDAWQRARNEEELGVIRDLRATFTQTGFVQWAGWQTVVKLCRRTKIRREPLINC